MMQKKGLSETQDEGSDRTIDFEMEITSEVLAGDSLFLGYHGRI